MSIRDIIFAAAGSSLVYEPIAYLKSQAAVPTTGWGGTVPSNNTWPRSIAMQKTTSYDSSVSMIKRGIWAIQLEYPNAGQYLGVVGRWYNLPNGYWFFNAAEAAAKGDSLPGIVPSTATISGVSVSDFEDAFVLRDTTDASYGGTRVIVQPAAGNYIVLAPPPAGTKVNWGSQAIISADGQWVYVNNSTSGAGLSQVYAYKANNTTTQSANDYNLVTSFGPLGDGFGAYALRTNALGSVITAWGFDPNTPATEAQWIWKRSGNTFTRYQILSTDSTLVRPVWGRYGESGTALSGDGQYFVVRSGDNTSGSNAFITIFKDSGTVFQAQQTIILPGIAGSVTTQAYSFDIDYFGKTLALYNQVKNAVSVYRRVGTTWSLAGDYKVTAPYTLISGDGVRINNDGTLITAAAQGGGNYAIAVWAI